MISGKLLWRIPACATLVVLSLVATAQTDGNTPIKIGRDALSPGSGETIRPGRFASIALSPMDRTFLKEASMGCLTQIRLDQIAGERGFSLDVHDLAQRIQSEDARLWGQISDLAARKGVRIHKALEPEALVAINHLSQLPTTGFPRTFGRMEVHRLLKALHLFQQEAVAHDSDPQVVHFAFLKIPEVRRRLDRAQKLVGMPQY